MKLNSPEKYVSRPTYGPVPIFSLPYLVRSLALMRQACVRLSSVCDVCIAAKRCVLEQKLLLSAYRKSYIRNRLVPKRMTLTVV